MLENPTILGKQPAGWTLIVLLIVVAIIAILMAIYLPSVLQMYSPPSSADGEGTRKPTLEFVEDQLEGIDRRNEQTDDLINQLTDPQKEQAEQEQQDDEE